MITGARSRAECRKHLRDNWDNPASEISFLGIDKLFHHYNGLISRSEIERILSSFESFTLQRQERRPNGRFDGFSMPRHIDNIIEVDSFDVTEISEENMGACHILCGINTFSKRLFAIPMLKRDGKSGLAAIKEIFRRARSLPDYLVSDKVFAKLILAVCNLFFFVFFHFGTENRTRSKLCLRAVSVHPSLFKIILNLGESDLLLSPDDIKQQVLNASKKHYSKKYTHS